MDPGFPAWGTPGSAVPDGKASGKREVPTGSRSMTAYDSFPDIPVPVELAATVITGDLDIGKQVKDAVQGTA